MTADKRTVTTDALETLGTIISAKEKRDAIHLAVEPVVAAMRLLPGDHVALDPAGRAVLVQIGEGVGIVDPFLANPALAGERFWLVVYPRQITSLRHVWEHPAFPPSELRAPTEAAPPVDPNPSRVWLEAFADHLDVTYRALMAHAKDWIEGGDYWSSGGDFEGVGIPDEFWGHYQIVTGEFVPTDRRHSFLSCSC